MARRRYWPAHSSAFSGGMLAIAGMLDAVLEPRSPLTSMPLSSSVALFALALGVVCARVDYSLGALLTSASLGGALTRWLWPAAVVAPVLLGMAARQAAAEGLVPRDDELVVLILSMITLLGALVVWNGYRLDQNDRSRQHMQDTLSRREAELREAHRLARIGSWRWDIADHGVTWSPELITERKLAEAELARVHRAQRATSRFNQMLVRASDEATLLQQVCVIIIENTDYRVCWVGRAEADANKTVRAVARAGPDGGYLDAAPFTWG